MEFETIIGLEVHCELDTESKAFCSCKVGYDDEANTNCCPVCMGLPGSLPVLNKKAVWYTVMMGLALNATINTKSYMARKNYCYPDLAKGYQISQSDVPLCENGYMETGDRRVRINRIHLEEDAGKLIHENDTTLIDYNRAGVALIEIVTEPDIRSGEEAKEFFEKIREIAVWLGISKGKMQEGNLRCDVNVSVREKGETAYNERCEMKNINSFGAVMRCIKYEEKRQRDILESGGTIKRETRRWDDERNESFVMRGKEEASDYRYFPEPDLLALEVEDATINDLRKKIPELPEEKRKRYMKEYGLAKEKCDVIVKQKYLTALFEEAMEAGCEADDAFSLICEIVREENERGIFGESLKISGIDIAKLTAMIRSGEISHAAGKVVLKHMIDEKKAPKEIVKEKGFTQISDYSEIKNCVVIVLRENKKSVEDYKKGKTNAMGYLMGQCMKRMGGRANPTVLREVLKEVVDND